MDREHTRYVRVTVNRLYYLLNRDDDAKGLALRILNRMSEAEDPEPLIRRTAERMNLARREILSDRSLYRRRKPREAFKDKLKPDETPKELTREEILSLNRTSVKYSRGEIREFIADRMENGRAVITADSVQSEEEFEKLILAYDDSVRKGSPFFVEEENGQTGNEKFSYPALVFGLGRNGKTARSGPEPAAGKGREKQEGRISPEETGLAEGKGREKRESWISPEETGAAGRKNEEKPESRISPEETGAAERKNKEKREGPDAAEGGQTEKGERAEG